MEGEEQTIKKLILFLSFLPLFVDTSSTSFRIQFRSNFGTTSFSTLLCGFSLPSSTLFFVAVALSWRNRKSGGVDVSIHGQIESRAKPFSFEKFFFLCDIFSRTNAHACTFLLPRNLILLFLSLSDQRLPGIRCHRAADPCQSSPRLLLRFGSDSTVSETEMER